MQLRCCHDWLLPLGQETAFSRPSHQNRRARRRGVQGVLAHESHEPFSPPAFPMNLKTHPTPQARKTHSATFSTMHLQGHTQQPVDRHICEDTLNSVSTDGFVGTLKPLMLGDQGISGLTVLGKRVCCRAVFSQDFTRKRICCWIRAPVLPLCPRPSPLGDSSRVSCQRGFGPWALGWALRN